MIACISRDADPRCGAAELIALIPAMRALARCLCVDPVRAEVLARDCVVAAWEGRRSLAPGDDPTVWAFAIVCQRFHASEDATSGGVTSRLDLGDFRKALAQLPADRREVLALVVAAGLSHRAAANVCGSSPGSIKVRLERARRELAGVLALQRRSLTLEPA